MNIIDRGQRFLHYLRDLFERKAWEWRRCPRCGDSLTCKWGSYERRPWCFEGRKRVRVQRHRCRRCQATYSESSALLVRGSWYAREVHRSAIDHWQHLGSSLRRSAEVMRSWLGRQERWQLWRPWDAVAGERCYLSASTVHRWLDGAGQRARQGVAGQLAGVPTSGQVGTDGLWARLRGGAKQVVLGLVDSVSGLVWPPVVVQGEEKAETWGQLFRRAQAAGLDLDQLRGVTSDGAKGLVGYLNQGLGWVNHQRCVFHLWRNLAGELAQVVKQGTEGLVGKAARKLGRQVRKEWVALIRGVWDAPSMAAAQEA
ncbi:MAG: transposase, partial [Dehalococcoidia bacterium]